MSTALLRLAFCALALLLLNGCASLSEGQCKKGNWTHVGEKDALDGWGPDRLADDTDACAKYGIRPDMQAWQAGYQHGLLAYCTATTGFAEGRHDAVYFDQCPKQLEGAFLAAYERGHDINSVEWIIMGLDSTISDLEDVIKDKDTSDSKRESARSKLRDVRSERWQRQSEHDELIEAARARGLTH
ncbi:DUF2799 domain-containing protein [soil metagenome]